VRDRRHFLKTGLGGLAGLSTLPLLSSLARSQTAAPDGDAAAANVALQTQQVTARVSVISQTPGNVIVLAAGDGLLLVDSGSEQLAPALRATLGSEPVHTLFNTHYHADQTGGNALFAKAGATIHAQTITKQWLAADY
jgi:glyoxylase-like metal-dependent hydrolase (beta-lactamase superfamily II)